MVKITLKVGPSWVEVYGLDSKLRNRLYEDLSSPNKQAFYINKKRQAINDRITDPSKRLPLEDTKFRMFDRTRDRFPTGALDLATKLLDSEEVKWAIVGERPLPPDWHGWVNTKVRNPWEYPYDYQGQSIESFFLKGRGILSVPTRGGKTTIGLFIASVYLRQLEPVLYLVTTVEAQRQVIEEFHDYINSGLEVHNDVSPRGLSVVTYATARNRELSHYRLVIADEVHRVPADTFFEVVQGCTNAHHRVGLTGTVTGRSDGKDLFAVAAIGPVIHTIDRGTLIERKLCSSGSVAMLSYNDRDTEWLAPRGDWRGLERVGITHNWGRNELLVEEWHKAWDGSQSLFMVEKIEHGENIQALLEERLERPVPFVHGKTPKSERDSIYEELADGVLDVAVASKIYGDSLTFPHLTYLINCSGGKSEATTRQKLGRALTGGDKEMLVIDCMDEHHKTLNKHAKARKRAYEKDGYRVVVV